MFLAYKDLASANKLKYSSDFYKKELVLDLVGPVGDVISEWVIKGAFIKNATFGDLDYDNDSAAQTIALTLGMDYCVLNF